MAGLPLPRTTGRRTTSSASGMLRPGTIPPPPRPQGSRHGHRLATGRKSLSSASGHENGDVIVWDARQEDALRTLNRGTLLFVLSVTLPSATCWRRPIGDRVCVWDPATGEFRKSLGGYPRPVRRIKWNAIRQVAGDKHSLSTRSESGIWRATNPSKSSRHRASWALDAWSPGFRVAWRWQNVCPGNRRELLRSCRSSIWKTRQNDRRVCANHTFGATDLEFSPDGLYTAQFGPRKVSVWNWAPPAETRSPEHPARSGVGSRALLFAAALGRPRNARAHFRFRRHRASRRRAFSTAIWLRSTRCDRGAGYGEDSLPPGQITPCGCGRSTMPPNRPAGSNRLAAGHSGSAS